MELSIVGYVGKWSETREIQIRKRNKHVCVNGYNVWIKRGEDSTSDWVYIHDIYTVSSPEEETAQASAVFRSSVILCRCGLDRRVHGRIVHIVRRRTNSCFLHLCIHRLHP